MTTSIEAYLRSKASRASKCSMIASYLYEKGGAATTKEITDRFAFDSNSVTGKRIGELVDQGCVVSVGEQDGYTLWAWEYDTTKWAANAEQANRERDIRLLERVANNERFPADLRQRANNIAAMKKSLPL